MEGKEAWRHMIVLFVHTLPFKTAINAEEEQAGWTQQVADFPQYGWQGCGGNMQQAIERVDGIEGGRGELQMQEVHLIGFQPFGSAERDHGGREVGTHHAQAILLKEKAILACPRPYFQQCRLPLLLQE